MMLPSDFSSKRNYILYLIAVLFDKSLMVITIIVLLVPCGIGALSDRISVAMDKICNYVNTAKDWTKDLAIKLLLRLSNHTPEEDNIDESPNREMDSQGNIGIGSGIYTTLDGEEK